MGLFSSKPKASDVQRMEKLIAENPVMVFSKSYCPFCDKTKELLKRKSIKYYALEMDQDSKGS